MNKQQLEEYLQFLIVQINDYRQDGIVNEDEFQMCTNELVRFKNLVASSGNLPEPFIKEVAKIKSKKGIKNSEVRTIFNAILSYRMRSSETDYTDEIDLLEYDLKKILNIIKLIN